MHINNLDSFHFEDIKNQEHPSVFFRHDNYDLFILRLPQYTDSDELEYKSFPFVITEKTYHYYDSNKDKFSDLKDINEFYSFLDKSIDNVLKILSGYVAKVEIKEDLIYQSKSLKNFNKEWYKEKTELIRINRVLSKAAEIIGSLISEYKKEDDYLERNFEDILEHIQRAYRNSGHLLEKLDSIYNFNLTQSNEEMNRIVYILTLLSGIFLPLNLIVGFFGMNTTSLPFTIGDGGTYKVIMLLVLTAFLATFLTYFMRKK